MPFPPPGDLPDPEIELASPAAPALADGLLTSPPPGNNLGLIQTNSGFTAAPVSTAGEMKTS